jgi:hypothetical protein
MRVRDSGVQAGRAKTALNVKMTSEMMVFSHILLIVPPHAIKTFLSDEHRAYTEQKFTLNAVSNTDFAYL